MNTEPLSPESSTALITLPKTSVMQVFTEQGAIDPLLAKIAEEVRNFVPDVSTPEGRAAIASLAYRVARTKTYLDGLGKDLVDEMKDAPRKVDATRKAMRDFLDALKGEARHPLDEWEAEQARIEAEQQALEAAEALAKEIEFTHEIGLLLNADFDRKHEEARKAEEAAKAEREERLRKEGEERAAKANEEKAKAEREAAARRETEAKLAQERAERAKAEAEQKLKDARAKAVQEKKLAEERAERAATEATQRERQRQEAQERAEADARAAQEKDKEQRRKINNQVKAALMTAGLNDTQAKAVIEAIALGKIPHLSIAYWEKAA